MVGFCFQYDLYTTRHERIRSDRQNPSQCLYLIVTAPCQIEEQLLSISEKIPLWPNIGVHC